MSTKVIKIVKPSKTVRHSTFPYHCQCPKCIITKNAMYVKHFKNLSGLDWHVSNFHKGEPWVKDFKIAIKHLAQVFEEIRP